MYEINTHNLKLYILVLSIIFILSNGFPILHIFTNTIDKNEYTQQNKYQNVKGDNFIMINNKNYDVNATVIKHSIIYNTKTESFTGSILLKYTNYIDTHNYCKIDIETEEKERSDIIYEFMYKYYNLSRNNIILYCNNNNCIHNLTKYNNIDDNNKFEEVICNILTTKEMNDEF